MVRLNTKASLDDKLLSTLQLSFHKVFEKGFKRSKCEYSLRDCLKVTMIFKSKLHSKNKLKKFKK